MLAEQGAKVARFKHMMGEYATVSAAALWLACYIIQSEKLPGHMLKSENGQPNSKRILIYNSHKGAQHSFLLLEK